MVFQREKLRGHSASFALASVQQLTAFRVSRFARAAVSWIIKKSKLKGINFGDGGAAPRKSRLWRSKRERFQKKENHVRGRPDLSRRTRALLEIDGVVARVFFFFFFLFFHRLWFTHFRKKCSSQMWLNPCVRARNRDTFSERRLKFLLAATARTTRCKFIDISNCFNFVEKKSCNNPLVPVLKREVSHFTILHSFILKMFLHRVKRGKFSKGLSKFKCL